MDDEASTAGARGVLAAVRRVPWWVVAAACLTLGLAPFRPQPHVVEKLGLLFGDGSLAPIDVFDLVLHGAPWLLLALRVLAQVVEGPEVADR